MSKVGHNADPEMTIDWGDYDGFIVEARSSRTHPLVGYGKQVRPADDARRFCCSVNEAWRDLLHECRYADGYVMNGGKRMLLERGALVGAISYLAYRWNWTPKTVRGFLDRLEADGMIEMRQPGINPGCTQELNGHHMGRQKGTQSQIISVCNYDKFNTPPEIQGHAQRHAEGTQRAREGHAKGMNHNKGTIDNRYTSTSEQNVASANTPLAGGAVDRKAINRLAARTGFTMWQDTARRCGLPVPRESSFDVYGQKIAARMFEHAEQPRGVAEMSAVWSVAMANIEKSSFLRGLDGKGFRADLKFICQRESFEKLITTGYGNGAHAAGRSEIAAIVGGLADRPITMIGDGDEMADLAARRSRDRGGAL